MLGCGNGNHRPCWQALRRTLLQYGWDSKLWLVLLLQQASPALWHCRRTPQAQLASRRPPLPSQGLWLLWVAWIQCGHKGLNHSCMGAYMQTRLEIC